MEQKQESKKNEYKFPVLVTPRVTNNFSTRENEEKINTKTVIEKILGYDPCQGKFVVKWYKYPLEESTYIDYKTISHTRALQEYMILTNLEK